MNNLANSATINLLNLIVALIVENFLIVNSAVLPNVIMGTLKTQMESAKSAHFIQPPVTQY